MSNPVGIEAVMYYKYLCQSLVFERSGTLLENRISSIVVDLTSVHVECIVGDIKSFGMREQMKELSFAEDIRTEMEGGVHHSL